MTEDAALDVFRQAVDCAAVLERMASGWKLDVRESTKKALEYRRGAGRIIIVNHNGRGWWDATGSAKGNVFRRLVQTATACIHGTNRAAPTTSAGLKSAITRSPFASCPVTEKRERAETQMNRRIFGGLSILLAASGPAAAQAPCDGIIPDLGPPSLHLSATEISKIAPDELVATMSTMATGARALTAQQQVNALVAKTKVVTDKAKGIKTAFQGYSVTFIHEKPTHWIAQQAVEVRGVNGDDVLYMVGQFQTGGLSITGPCWASLTRPRRQGASSGDHRRPSQVARSG